jgi:hypothetical protein
MGARARAPGVTRLGALLVAALVAGCAGARAEREPVSAPIVSPSRLSGFPIVAWWGPPGTARRQDFVRYRDAGFTLHATNPDEGFTRALDHVQAVGLASLVFREHQGFDLTPLAEVAFPADRPSVVGWITGDEPSSEAEVTRHVDAVSHLVRDDPGRLAFFNLLSPSLQGPPGTERVVDLAVRAGMRILSYDHYAILAGGGDDTEAFYRHLDLFRRLSVRHQVPFWAFALTISHGRYRRPSESDLRWQQYSNLAYGAKGLWYFTYWAPRAWPGWDSRGIVDAVTGAPTELYDAVRRVNLAVRDMGSVLLELTPVDVSHTSPPRGQRAFARGHAWLRDVRARDALVTSFRHADGTPYVMVVNKRHGPALDARAAEDAIEIEVAPDVVAVDAVSWLDGTAGPLALRARRMTLDVAGGTGVLLRLRLNGGPGRSAGSPAGGQS